jgi:hypothetical protein
MTFAIHGKARVSVTAAYVSSISMVMAVIHQTLAPRYSLFGASTRIR